MGIPAQYNRRSGSVAGGDQTARASELVSLGVAAVFAAFYLATSIYIASHRLLWFDEILTVDIARLPNYARVWDALAHGADGMPPGYHVLTRIFARLVASPEVAVRLPSALAMAAGLLITFDCARRVTNGSHGLVALAALTCSFLPYYGYEGRSYAVYFMLAALSLWLWVCTPNDSWWSAAAFGAVLFVSVAIHYYAVLLVVPYALWEVYCWKPWQLPSPKLTAGVLGVGVAAALMSKLMLGYSRQFSAGFWATPSFNELRAIFYELFPDGLLLLVLIVIWIVVTTLSSNPSVPLNRRPAAESVGWLFLCIPLAGFVLAKWKTNAFLSRYFIGALPGIALAFTCLLWRYFRNARPVSLGVLLLLATWGTASQLRTALHPDSVDPNRQQTKTRQYLGLEGPLRGEGKRFLVFSSSVLHVEVAHYSAHPEDCILLLPSDLTHTNIQNLMEFKLAQYAPLQFWTIDDLKEHAPEAALIEPRPDVLDDLRRAGLRIVIRPQSPTVAYLQ